MSMPSKTLISIGLRYLFRCLTVIPAVFVMGDFCLQAGPLSIDWFTISGSGGSSSGGTLEIAGFVS